jgi:hypothetical protein
VSESLSRHAPSAHRFDFAVTLCVIGILATWLLHYLNQAQADVEKVILNTELKNLRLGLAETWIHKSITNQPINIEALKGSNPMQLIAERPRNYMGELAQAPRASKAIWYFDTKKKQLIYVFIDGRQAAYKLVGTAGLTRSSVLSIGGLDLVQDAQKVK